MEWYSIDKPFKLNKPLKVRGKWWAHDTPDHKVSGVLRFSSKGIRLELDDLLTKMPFEEVVQECFGKPSRTRYPCVYGRSSDGRMFTLLDVFPGRSGITMDQTPISCCIAQHLIVACYVPHVNLTIRHTHFRFRGLDDFTQFEPVQMQKILGLEGELAPVYVPPTEILIAVPSAGVTFSMGTVPTHSFSRKKAVVSARTQVNLAYDKPVSLEQSSDTINRLCHWFTLFFDRAISPHYVLLDISDEHMGWLLYGTRWWSDESLDHPLFRLEELKDRLPSLLNTWFLATGSLLSALHLYVEERAVQHTYEGRLLILTQALEAFCQATIPGAQTRKAQLMTLLGMLHPSTVAMICNSPDDFATGVVATRNFFTHYSDDKRGKALDHQDLFWACEKLSWLLRINLLKWIGLDESEIADRFGMYYGWKTNAAKAARECMP